MQIKKFHAWNRIRGGSRKPNSRRQIGAQVVCWRPIAKHHSQETEESYCQFSRGRQIVGFMAVPKQFMRHISWHMDPSEVFTCKASFSQPVTYQNVSHYIYTCMRLNLTHIYRNKTHVCVHHASIVHIVHSGRRRKQKHKNYTQEVVKFAVARWRWTSKRSSAIRRMFMGQTLLEGWWGWDIVQADVMGKTGA